GGQVDGTAVEAVAAGVGDAGGQVGAFGAEPRDGFGLVGQVWYWSGTCRGGGVAGRGAPATDLGGGGGGGVLVEVQQLAGGCVGFVGGGVGAGVEVDQVVEPVA